ncbi:transcriptional regulator [Enterobacter sp. Ap-916]|uniref:helix-turn-helix domain-containing protein n=1 Tax=unclassified Enterobacter TaxID=2608935 RepID=UPI001420FE1F|nr:MULTISPECIES: helix-turn-helix transcriptional regulator [unclassified Enterobacter]NIF60157.1 transcriptional regulator [Enterobacter sp. Ap-867]NIG31564.1 transcriptional regulator [Enterobacter sp. Ap-916]
MAKGWNPADIIAGLCKKGISLAALSRECGLASSTLANALTRPWPKGEFLIAKALGLHPSEIWPERYVGADGEIVDRERSLRGNRELMPSSQ